MPGAVLSKSINFSELSSSVNTPGILNVACISPVDPFTISQGMAANQAAIAAAHRVRLEAPWRMYWPGAELFRPASRRRFIPAKRNFHGLARQNRLRAGSLLQRSEGALGRRFC